MPESPIDTRGVKGRRTLRFDDLKQMLADVDALARADRAGNLKCLGNWTLGQTLNHLAVWIDYAYDGYPIKTSWLIRMMARPMKKRLLNKGFWPGGRLPKVAGGTFGNQPVDLDEALEHLRKAADHLKSTPPTKKHIILGNMTHNEMIKLNLRHAELHLSFMKAD